MAKKEEKTIYCPVFEKQTQKRLEKDLNFKKQIKPFTKTMSSYCNYDDRMYLCETETKQLKEFKIKSVAIDKSFEEWLEKNHKKLSINSLNEYMQQVTDEESDILLKKNHFNLNLFLSAYPLIITDKKDIEETNYKFSEENKKRMQEILERVYGHGNVWVPGVVIPAKVLGRKKSDLINKAFDYFSGKSDIRLSSKYDVQKNKAGENVFSLCVPFVIKNEFNSSVYHLKNIYDLEDIDEMKSITYFTDKIIFLNEYEDYSPRKLISVKNMSTDEYINSASTDIEFSIEQSGFKNIIDEEITLCEGQDIMTFTGWDDYSAIKSAMENYEEILKSEDCTLITLNGNRSYIDQLEEYIKDKKTAENIIHFLSALGNKVVELSGKDLDKVPDDEKENIVILIDYINEYYYQAIYPTMTEKFGYIPDIFDIAEYFRFEMSAAGMKADLQKLDPEIVKAAQEIVKRIWSVNKAQNFTFAIMQGEEVVNDVIYKIEDPMSSKADENLYIVLVHYCAAMMMLGGGLTVRTFVDKNREEVFAIKGGNWDWNVCSEEEIRSAYTTLPDGSYLEPDENTVFTEITRD